MRVPYLVLIFVRAYCYCFLVLIKLDALLPVVFRFNTILGPEPGENLDPCPLLLPLLTTGDLHRRRLLIFLGEKKNDLHPGIQNATERCLLGFWNFKTLSNSAACAVSRKESRGWCNNYYSLHLQDLVHHPLKVTRLFLPFSFLSFLPPPTPQST